MNALFLSSYSCLERSIKGESTALALEEVSQGVTPRLAKDIQKLVTGVIEEDKKLQKTLDAYAKGVRPKIKIILKMGIYCFENMLLPPYTVVNDLAELTKTSGKKQLVGFVNATLRNILRDKENQAQRAQE